MSVETVKKEGQTELQNEAKLTDLKLDKREDSVMDELADIVFTVEGRDIKAMKSVLCLASPVFRAMLGPNFKENGENGIPLPGKKYASFNEFLECFNPNIMRPVTVHNVYKVLPLINEYQVDSLKPHCENVLMCQINETSKGSEIYRLLRMAEQYSIQGGIKEKCWYLASELNVAHMKRCEQKYAVSTKSQLEIKELALMRYDLMKEDEFYVLKEQNLPAPQVLEEEIHYICKVYFSETRRAVSKSFTKIPTEITNVNVLRVLRICYRYMADDMNIIAQLVKFVRQLKATFTAEDTQVYELLPEQIKHDIRGRYVATM